MPKPNITNKAFWDVDFEKIDYEKSSVFVIDKVFNYGIFNDIIEIIRFYGEDRIKKDVVKIPYFRKQVFAFVCGFFELNESEFVAFNRRRHFPKYWNQ